MPTGAHQLPWIRVCAAVDEQLGDPTAQLFDVSGFDRVSGGDQGGDICLDALGESDRDAFGGRRHLRLLDVDTQIAKRLRTVFGPLGGSATNPLGGESRDFVVGAAPLESLDE